MRKDCGRWTIVRSSRKLCYFSLFACIMYLMPLTFNWLIAQNKAINLLPTPSTSGQSTTAFSAVPILPSSAVTTTFPLSATTTTTTTTLSPAFTTSTKKTLTKSSMTLAELPTSSTLSTIKKQSNTLIPSVITPTVSLEQIQKDILVVKSAGRLGNQMFQFASAYGMAKRAGRRLVCAGLFAIADNFQLGVETVKFNHPYLFKLPIIREKFCCRLDEELYNKTLPINSPRGLAVEGYLQSWAYFKDHFADIRRIFTSFNSNVTNQINRFYASIYNATSSSNSSFMSPTNEKDKANSSPNSTPYYLPKFQNHTTFVGVHVRRKDMKVPDAYRHGFLTGESEFVGRAMLHYIKRYSHVTFIICSDDLEWCRQHIVLPEMFKHTFAIHYCNDDDSPIVHMGILAACSHSISCGGTYGWWAGFLAGGEVVYFSGYPRPGSPFWKHFSKSQSDYYLPGWIGMW